MSPDEQKRLGAFLKEKDVDHAHAYLKLSKTAGSEACEAAIEKRRLWAQAQQTNPRYQDEAIWVLSNLDLLREALTKTDEELLWIDSAKNRVFDDQDSTNFYELLGLSPSASQAEIQDAHRLRYRDARHLKDRHEAHRLYAVLDEAWRVLSDETLRREYDKSNRESTELQLAEPETQTERQILTEAPNLRFIGSSRMSINVGQKIVSRSLEIERCGPGLIDATTRCDQPWLNARPERLDPHLKRQSISLEIDPQQLPGKSALGQVVIQNFSGQRLACHVRVERRSMRKRLLIVASISALFLGTLFVLSPAQDLFRENSPTTRPAPLLQLTVQPVPAQVYVNDREVGFGQQIALENLPNAQPFLLRVEAPGHLPYREHLVLDGQDAHQKTVLLEPENGR